MEFDELSPTPDDLEFHGVTSRYADIEGVIIDPANVPENLRHLIPLAKYWSIGDDSERADMMWLTPYEELKAMVLAVRPMWDEIRNWSFAHYDNDSVTDEVVIFDMLGQAAAEADALHVDVEET
jgi:hypothetical protein